MTNMSRKLWAGLAGVLLFFFLLALMLSATKRPWMDEAWVANPAIDLVTRGMTGVTVMEPTGHGVLVGLKYSGIEDHTYLWLPFAAVLQSVWYRILGFSVFSVRGFSVFWGLIGLLCWFYIVRKISGLNRLALLTMALIAIDGSFLDAASDGRVDMLSASLALCAVTAYLHFRQSNLPSAVLSGSALATAAFLTHPVGGVGFAVLLLLYIHCDRGRFLWWHPALPVLPLLLAAAGWGWYILQNPADFRAQTASLFQGRLGGIRAPWTGIVREFTERYLDYYLPSTATGFKKVKVLILATYFLTVAVCLGVRPIRKHPKWRVLLLFAPLYMLLFAIFEGGKMKYYLVYLTPPMALCLAIVSTWCWNHSEKWRRVIVPVLVGFGLLQVGWAATLIARNPYRTEYTPVAQYLNEYRQSSDLVYGCGEWAFVLGFYGHFRIDTTLGYTTGKRAKFIVWEDRCMQQALAGYALKAPPIHRYMTDLLAREYRVAFKNSYYTVYKLNAAM